MLSIAVVVFMLCSMISVQAEVIPVLAVGQCVSVLLAVAVEVPIVDERAAILLERLVWNSWNR